MNRQIRRLGLVLMLLFCALFVQLSNWQVVKANKLANDPRNARVTVRDFNRPRGVIQTSDGVVIAESKEVKNGVFDRKRVYPEGKLFGHVTGFFSFTYLTEGVEKTYGDELTGKLLRARDLPDLLTERYRTNNVTLSISKKLQKVAADQLGNRKGAVVALDPRDGAIRAMWSFPSYDPSPLSGHNQKEVKAAWKRLQGNSDKPMFPRAFRETYPPGSTFKVVTAASALERESELATKSYPVLTSLDLPLTNASLKNFGGSSCGGQLPQLLRVSCNTGFGQMGLDLGAEKLVGESEDFGFNQRPPLDLSAPSISIFPNVASFDENTPALAQSAIGQRDVAASPLQMALLAAAVANEGEIMEPRVMQEISNSEGQVVKDFRAKTWKRPISADNAQKLKEMMIGVVNGGTGGGAAIPGIQVAAKTGTAQTTGDEAHAWMIAFAPAENPEIAIAVIVERQPGIGDLTGGRTAAPIVKAVIEAALNP